MGRDKALLSGRSGLLVEEVAGKVQAACGSVTLIGNPHQYGHLPYECLPDLHPGHGPLSGLETALQSDRGELNLIVACDMPGVSVDWLRRLSQQALERKALCTALLDSDEVLQPLCAVYRTECLPVIQRALAKGHLKLLDVLKQLNAETVAVSGLVANLNTPEDWTAWQEAGVQ